MRSIRALVLAAAAAATLVACNLYIDDGHGGTKITGPGAPDAGITDDDGGRFIPDASIGGLDGGCVDYDGGSYGLDASIGGLDAGRGGGGGERDAGVQRPDAR